MMRPTLPQIGSDFPITTQPRLETIPKAVFQPLVSLDSHSSPKPLSPDKTELTSLAPSVSRNPAESNTLKNQKLNVGFLLYQGLTGLDFVGPHEVLSRSENAITISKDTNEIVSDRGLILKAETDFSHCPHLDVLVVPGGPGADKALQDSDIVKFVREKAEKADIVASVCTGALLVAATGLIKNRVIATHWLAHKELERLGSIPSKERVAIDGKFWSSAGVSAGIDLGLTLVAKLSGDEAAQMIQLQMEYDPRPPFSSGNPETAPKHLVDSLRKLSRYPQQ